MKSTANSRIFLSLVISSFLILNVLPSSAVEFGQDATGDPNAVQIQGNTSGFLYSERIILTAAHVLKQLRIQPNGDTDGFVFAPGLADKTSAKRYKIVKAFIPKTFVDADPARGIQPLDDFAIVVTNEDIPLKMKVAIATDEQMMRFARERVKVEMVGYGLQSGSQRSNPQELLRAPHKLSAYLLTPEMMSLHYNQYRLRPPYWSTTEWGANSNQTGGTPCNGDSGSGYFVQENSIRIYVGTAGNGLGVSNCRADGTYSLNPGGAVSWFPSPNKFLELIKSAENFVDEQRKIELQKAEEARLTAELKAKQEAEAKAKAEADAKAKAEADRLAAELKAKQEAEAKAEADRLAAELKAKQEAEAKAKSQATKKTTITCIKGKLVKKVTAVNPKCPAGYKKK